MTKVAKKKIVRINNQFCKSNYLPYCRSDKHLKGVTGNVWWLNWVCSMVEHACYDSFQTYKTFSRCITTENKCKVDVQNYVL